jgi:hypothetical protein
MAEMLAPGVYVEETNFRARGITGAVEDLKTAFIGPARFGPTTGKPLLVTSFVEFERLFGGLEPLDWNADEPNYLAHAVRAFFENGGRQVYVARIFQADPNRSGRASIEIPPTGGLELEARYPGSGGNRPIEISMRRSGSLAVPPGDIRSLGLRDGDFVQSVRPDDPLTVANLHRVVTDPSGVQRLDPPLATAGDVHVITLTVRIGTETYGDISLGALGDVFPAVGSALRAPPVIARSLDAGSIGACLVALAAVPGKKPFTGTLTGGHDGVAVTSADYTGGGEGTGATGLVALQILEDVAVVAAPGSSALPNDARAVREALIAHAENTGSRMAILAGPRDANRNMILDVRSAHASSYAALYYPWVVIRDPKGGRWGEEIALPPEGFVAGVFARTARERGIHKAPANEPVRGVLRFAEEVTRSMQDLLNPEGVNVLRSFESEGRGHRIWGARTMSRDPLWQYVNVRRLFLFLRRSIDVGTQWVVFEPNHERTWLKVRMGVEAFLMDQWRAGALVGRTPAEAFFVSCDRTTMTQTDLDNGRLVCVVGVAPTTPAEFVVFRIGQWTAQSSAL